MASMDPNAAFPTVPAVRVITGGTGPERQELHFSSSFRIGRAEDCGFRVQNEYVSRYQAQVVYENGRWLVRDLNSSNGLYIGDERVKEVPVTDTATIRLGVAGPEVSFTVE